MQTPDLQPLNFLAARVGRDPSLVQGPGGNVSLKDGGTMWIKASGTWLAHALEKPIMVPVDLPALRAGLLADDPDAEACVAYVRNDLNPSGLRPSIETSVHALMPQRVVVHVHCVETIAWAAQRNAAEALAGLLAGLRWRFVPYGKPGLSLARAMRAAAVQEADVVVLGNHGLVVAADSPAAASDLLDAVVERLRRPVRAAPAAQLAHLQRLARDTDYEAPDDAALHPVGTDPQSLAAARAGSLYPDHVIFLGPGIVALEDGETVVEAVRRARRPTLPLLVVPSAGVLIRRDATAGARALAQCLSDVTARLGATPLAVLSAADEAALLDWDAEKYRQALDRSGA